MNVEAYLTRMRRCASQSGRELAEISDRHRAVRLVESDAASVERGFAAGLLAIESAHRLRTMDPRQRAAWLVEGDPAHLCWEYLPHMAAYVELVLDHGFPLQAVRFDTPEEELRLDLAALNEDGRVLVLGEAKAEPLQLRKLEALVPTFEGDPHWPGGSDATRDAQKLAHQLWATRAPYLWLVAAGTRRAFKVSYGRTMTLTVLKALPAAETLWPSGFGETTPRIAVPARQAAAG